MKLAATHPITVAGEREIAAKTVDVAKNKRSLPRAPHAQIGLRLDFGARPFHARAGSGHRLDVELQVAEEGRTGRGPGYAFFGGDKHACDFDSLGQRDALDGHTAREHRGPGSPS